jgi:hypothetical protein
MRRLWDNRTLRGFAIIALVALTIIVLQLYATLIALGLLVRIAFFLAIAYFVFLVWRERRSEIDMWSTRAKTVFYGAAILAVVDVAQLFVLSVNGLDAVIFLLVLVGCGYAMWRIWHDQHTYG